ncbi:MAG: DUF3048 domain-containing protein [Oscillospiraceae bacterium]|nr:DUF3048 domain-containing protein [Oscillospiraceae bacterium]
MFFKNLKKSRLFKFIGRHKKGFVIGLSLVLPAAVIAGIVVFSAAEPIAEEPAPSPSPVPAPTPTLAPQPTPDIINFPNPLTGEEMTDPEWIDKRPVSVMHNNLKAAMPLVGVSRADMLYEIPVEGGITRIMGIYQEISDVPLIGAIRSARTCYLEVSLAHDAVLAHCGASSLARQEFKQWGMDHIDAITASTAYFWRDQGRRAAGYSLEHCMMSDGGKILELYKKLSRTERKEELRQVKQKFTPEPDIKGEKAENFALNVTPIKQTSFAFDSKTRKYTPSQHGAVMRDGGTKNTNVEVSGIIIIQTPMSVLPGKSGHMKIDMQSGGSGYYITDGKIISIKWSRGGLYKPFAFALEDGTPLTMTRGKHYICVTRPGSQPIMGG